MFTKDVCTFQSTFTMFRMFEKVVNQVVDNPAVWPTFARSVTFLYCFVCCCRNFYCCLHHNFLQNKVIKYKMPKRKVGKLLYSATEVGEMICMNSDSEGGEIDLGEDLELDSDLDQDDTETKNSDDNSEEDAMSPTSKRGNSFHLAE